MGEGKFFGHDHGKQPQWNVLCRPTAWSHEVGQQAGCRICSRALSFARYRTRSYSFKSFFCFIELVLYADQLVKQRLVPRYTKCSRIKGWNCETIWRIKKKRCNKKCCNSCELRWKDFTFKLERINWGTSDKISLYILRNKNYFRQRLFSRILLQYNNHNR